ncbi:hydantoinase B/oxoprolinase family protein [Marinimicrobium alkaliphilum]|uniref:hydantoinase B/oxoprolinase family protein n=1 Tax=Marinimicrobium alkaliphilum TaxID=2202654 RepID=UPI000DBA1F3D|nr:hydantoinase B/oxoprolinase family protein [Marinimicrobium alkaliphilum]
MDPIQLSVFASRIEAVCDEMGAVLKRAAFSPNIKDRLDFSCAVFDAEGQLCAQAAHIPVHLGSMAYAMADVVRCIDWAPGDMAVVNDPYMGGTHLPDVTVIAPVFVAGVLLGFTANRAHHANIGATSPGSMPISRSLEEEGVVIAPTLIVRAGAPVPEVMDRLAGDSTQARGDFTAQVSASRVGAERLGTLIDAMGVEQYGKALVALNDYAERLARSALAEIPDGVYRFTDVMDDDGLGHTDIAIAVTISLTGDRAEVDFTGTAGQVPGNTNCPLSVAAAAVFYAFRCLMPDNTPACAGSFRPIRLHAPEGCLLNARYPAAVAAGNVETSTRTVDAVLGALAQAIPARIPAASNGSMNNVAMGSRAVDGRPAWDYYETNGGGMGAGHECPGWSGVQTHMTNTLNTPIESLETHYPLRITRYELRPGSGGAGQFPGGLGLVREFEFLAPTQVTLLTERRRHAPWGLAGGEPGAMGENRLNGERLAPKVSLNVAPGDRLSVATPGGGGYRKG